MANRSPFLKVFLIGLPGSGKTTLAKEMAVQAKLKFFDLDEEIEKFEQTKVGDIFSTKGEIYFREVETAAIKKVSNTHEGFVMATGGGVPCFNDNLQFMKKEGLVIFLDVPVADIVNRISNQSINRPLLKSETPESLLARIEFLRNQRISFYQQAHHTIVGEAIQAKDVLDIIFKKAD